MITNSIETVLVILLLMGTGFFISWKGWYSKEHKNLMTKLIVNISIPAVAITNFFTSFSRETLFSSGNMVLLSSITMLISYGIGILFSKILKLDKSRRASFVAMCTVSNSMFIGLPVCLGLFGDPSIPYVMFYYIANTVVFWALCVPRMRSDGEGEASSLIETIKRIFTVPLIAVFICMLLVLINFKPPSLVLETAKYLGALSTPLSLIFVGGIMYEIGLKNIRVNKSTITIMLMRFLIAPALTFFIFKTAGIGELATQVFTIQTAMPVMILTVVVAENYKVDSNYVAEVITITTLASLVFIPIYMTLMPKFF